jgi:RNA polymerase primary sigma factor
LHLDNDPLIVDDPLRIYLAELEKVPALGREEEAECIEHVRAGDERAEDAGKRLVEANLQLVVTIARSFSRDDVHLLDLIEEGNRGLMIAVQTLRESSADSLSIHATPLIQHAITEAIAVLSRVKDSSRHLK